MYKEKLPKNCPPKSAVENDLVILYRIFQGNKLDANEFLPYNILYPNNNRFQQMCDAFAISFYSMIKFLALYICYFCIINNLYYAFVIST
jgi:hypothetical protein